MDTTENTNVEPEPIELKAKVSRKALIIGSAAVGALSALVLTALAKKTKNAEIIVLEPTAEIDEV